MLTGPLAIGISVGIATIALTLILKKSSDSKMIVLIPGIISILIAAFLFYLGYVNIRGFDGGAYMALSVIILFFSVLGLFITSVKTD